MILGRNTLQWMGLITALTATVQTIASALFPDIGPLLSIVLGAITGFLGVLIAFIANTSTTPIGDARLPAGTNVTVTPTTSSAPGTADQVFKLPEPGVPPQLPPQLPAAVDEPAPPDNPGE